MCKVTAVATQVKIELGGEHYAANASDAAAKAIVDGRMNSNCGGGLMNHVCDAIEEGLMTQDDLVARVNRSFTLLMDAGGCTCVSCMCSEPLIIVGGCAPVLAVRA